MSAARVVAANESRSEMSGPASSEHGSLDSSSDAPEPANTSRTQFPDVCPSGRGCQRDETSYEPYVHVLTGQRVQIPISIDPQTARISLPMPDGMAAGDESYLRRRKRVIFGTLCKQLVATREDNSGRVIFPSAPLP